MKLPCFTRLPGRFAPALLLALMQLPATAQTVTNNGAAITVQANALVFVDGTVSNTASSTVANNGTIQLTGDFTGPGTLTGSSGVLSFTGTQNQLLDAPAGTTVATLSINNSGAVNNNRLSIPNDLTVSTSLLMVSGMARTAPAATITLPDGATIAGEATGRYVQGNLEVIRNATSSPTVFGHGVTFDGTGQNLGPVRITRTAGLLTTDVSFGQNFANSSFKGIDRIWTIATANAPTAPVPLTFSWLTDDDHGITDFSQARIWEQAAAGQPWAIHSATANASGRSISASFSTLARFTVSNAANPLPVELARFTAERQGNDGQLHWATASEKNNDHFVVESSTDGRAFRQLGQVAGHGTSTQPQEYRYADVGLARYAAPVVYYRLRQVDKDGAESFSPVRSIAVSLSSGFAVAALPNPVRDADLLHLQVRTAEAGPATLLVTDALGRTLLKQQLLLTAETNGIALPEAARWPQGVYLLRVQQGTQHQSVKVVRD